VYFVSQNKIEPTILWWTLNIDTTFNQNLLVVLEMKLGDAGEDLSGMNPFYTLSAIPKSALSGL
jgi:hypothetical protein